MKVVGIVPVRLASSRFPRKPLAKILGISMTEHVIRRSRCASLIDDIYVATCDQEIAIETERFGAKAILTSAHHTRGTDRVAEAARQVKADIVINIQGDEPMVCPDNLDEAITKIKNNGVIQALNLITPIQDWETYKSPNVVKIVIDQEGKALYLSRCLIPFLKTKVITNTYRQIGVYLFRGPFLNQFTQWQETPLERLESVDMLRILERGFPLHTHISKNMIGVDVPEDVLLVEKALRNDPLYQRIFSSASV